MAGGRPLKFKSVEELDEKVNQYFTEKPREEWMITGLAVWLETSRDILIDYQERDEFSNTIKAAKVKIEAEYERRAWEKDGAFRIFALKNMGWKDKFEQEYSGKNGAPIDHSLKVEFVNGKRPDTSEV